MTNKVIQVSHFFSKGNIKFFKNLDFQKNKLGKTTHFKEGRLVRDFGVMGDPNQV